MTNPAPVDPPAAPASPASWGPLSGAVAATPPATADLGKSKPFAPGSPVPVSVPRTSDAGPLPLETKPQRLESLDVFRGITIAAMVLVNNIGKSYWPLGHAEWHGWTPTDLIFPFFLFIVGVAIPYSMSKRRASAENETGHLAPDRLLFGLGLRAAIALIGIPIGIAVLTLIGVALGGTFRIYNDGGGAVMAAVKSFDYSWAKGVAVKMWMYLLWPAAIILLWGWRFPGLPRLELLINVIRRSAMLFALGLLMMSVPVSMTMGWFTEDNVRVFGVLQRIALCFLVVASLFVLLPATTRWLAVGTLLLGVATSAIYLVLMLTVAPDNASPGEKIDPWSFKHNIVGRVDRGFAYTMGWDAIQKNTARLYRPNTLKGAAQDPEGLLSTLPAITTTALGVLAGLWLRSRRDMPDKSAGLAVFGLLALILGALMEVAGIPYNKPIWTPSYAVMAAGWAFIFLAACHWIIDVKRVRLWAWPFKMYGMNALFIFVGSGIIARWLSWMQWDSIAKREVSGFIYRRLEQINLAPSAGKMPTFNLGGVDYEFLNLWTRDNQALTWGITLILAWFLIATVMYFCRIFVKV